MQIKLSRRFIPRSKQRGQGMTEYIVVTALIGVAAIAVFMLYGNTIRTQTAGMAKEMSGQTAQPDIAAAQAAATMAATRANTSRGLGTYNNQQGDGAPPAAAAGP